ncbi:E-selectin-like [Branchiostoma floridae]|uniref:E-selectin-like n=1 Tax=Branchiostoma floridae TaxID=7739 RepID=A0A9J7L453_BRAFL|nr:E-selectin-like [Branchiostoma floridae]
MRVFLLTAAVLTLLLLIDHEVHGNSYYRRRRRRTTTRPPIDCQWSSWSLYSSDCGNSCQGTRIYTRYRCIPAENGGRDCEGPSEKTEPCPDSGCQNGGQWDGAYCNCLSGYAGSCCQRRVTCPPLDAPSNGHIGPHGMSPGDEVHFSCDPGYSLLGSSSATCQSDGNWSNNRPICQRSSCPALPVVQHGSMYGSMTIGSTMTFSCLDGYTLSGPSSITCTGAPNGQGVWSAQSPTCTVQR